MKVLVLGQDGRAHAFVWKLFNSPGADELICAPGNGGISQLSPLLDVQPQQVREIANWCFQENIDIIMPISSQALSAGLVDELVSLHLGVCGPPQGSTHLARSRCYAKEFLLRHNLPTARGQPFTRLATAEKYLAAQTLPVMLKADHPDVPNSVYHDRYAALTGLRDLFGARTIEGDSEGVVIEEFLPGMQVSFSCFTDGKTVLPLLPTRMYNHLEAGDRGDFAAGMGAHTSTSAYAHKLKDYMHQKLMLPIIAALQSENLPYWGILGIDCIITQRGPRITTLRCGMNDMEAQVVLPRLEDDLLPIIQATIAHRLHTVPPLHWRDEATVGIALVPQGYPHHFAVGNPIGGLTEIEQGILVFHHETHNPFGMEYNPASHRGPDPLARLLMGAGSSTNAAAMTTTGGHVLTDVARGATLQEAHQRAVLNAERITFAGRLFRNDIGAQDFA
jgi:phosphoribosylamine--glycine ligase